MAFRSIRRFQQLSSLITNRTMFTEIEKKFVSPSFFYNQLASHSIDFYTGVPDSLLKDYTSYIETHSHHNIVTANEGLSVSLASGYHLATGKIPCVYLQNSGLGNLINPLLSLVHENVYHIPMLFLIGWRGEPYCHDEPQHSTQGQITEQMLRIMDINYQVLSENSQKVESQTNELVSYMKETQKPAAFLIRRQTFETAPSPQNMNQQKKE